MKGEEAPEDVPEEDEVDTAIVDELSEALAMVSAGMRNSVESIPVLEDLRTILNIQVLQEISKLILREDFVNHNA